MVMVHQFWLLHGYGCPMVSINKIKMRSLERWLRSQGRAQLLQRDHIQVPEPTTGGSQTLVAPASEDLMPHHMHRTKNKTKALKKKEHLSYPSVLTF